MINMLEYLNYTCDVFKDIKDFGNSVLTIILWIIGIVVALIILLAIYINIIDPKYKKYKREQSEKAFLAKMPAKYDKYSKDQLVDIRNHLIKMCQANNKSAYYDKKARTEYVSRDDSINNLVGALAGGMIADQHSDELRKKYGLSIANAELELKYINSILK